MSSPARDAVRDDGPDSAAIREMFDGFADRYDTFTKWIGFGRDEALRRHALAGIRRGDRVLDLACGTGALAFGAEARGARVVGVDFSEKMIERARSLAAGKGIPENRLRFEIGAAEDLPLGGERFDRVVSAYALRNLHRSIDRILKGVRESLAPEGRIAFLDLTEPEDALRRALFRAYFYGAVGLYGKILFGSKYPAAYLPESADRFQKAAEFRRTLERAGFRGVETRGFFLGAVTLYTARR